MKRYKLNYNRPKLSEQELTKKMSFDEFINNAPPAGSSNILKALKSTKTLLIAGIAAVAIVAGYFIYDSLAGKSNEEFIDPPFENANIALASYTIDVSKDTTIVHETGSTITIPANAFADETGKPVHGTIELRYREFHDPIEVIMSGIPMQYDSAGVQYQFESAGMFELLAFKDGKPLMVNSSAMPFVNLVSLTGDNDFNIYYLDTVAKHWQFISANTGNNNTKTVLFDALKQSSPGSKEENASAVPFQQEDTNRPSFIIDYSAEDFPELAVFEGLKFQVAKDDDSYDPKLASKIWQDVYIKRVDDKRYTVTFSRENESHTFDVVPVVEAADFEKKMEEYSKGRLDRRNDEFRKQETLKANYEKYVAEGNWENVNTRINRFMSQYPDHITALAIRRVNVPRTGMWNCDRPMQLEMPRFVKAAIYDQDGQPLNTKRVYLLTRNQNIYYTYSPEKSAVNMRYSTVDAHYLLAITSEGYAAYMSEGEFSKAVNAGDKPELKMNVIKKPVKGLEELKLIVKKQG